LRKPIELSYNKRILPYTLINLECINMGYSYFPTERAAQKWAIENLDFIGNQIALLQELPRHEQTDYSKWFIYYPLRHVK